MPVQITDNCKQYDHPHEIDLLLENPFQSGLEKRTGQTGEDSDRQVEIRRTAQTHHQAHTGKPVIAEPGEEQDQAGNAAFRINFTFS